METKTNKQTNSLAKKILIHRILFFAFYSLLLFIVIKTSLGFEQFTFSYLLTNFYKTEMFFFGVFSLMLFPFYFYTLDKIKNDELQNKLETKKNDKDI